MIRQSIFALAMTAGAAPAFALTDNEQAFVEANVLSIFYHELGHAVIDLMQVPIFGQEEDAADVMAVLLIDWLFDEQAAQDIAYDSAFGYINDPEQIGDVAYWDNHGPDEQRYFNHICLFYGANPDERDDLAEDLGLPEERRDTCPDEYDQAANSWGMIFDEMEQSSAAAAMRFTPSASGDMAFVNALFTQEIESLNADLRLPERVDVRVEACDEPNAFYDPTDRSIIFCEEFVPHLVNLANGVTPD